MQLLKMQMNEMVMGGSVSVWKLLILLLSAEFTRSRSSAIDEAEKDDQLDEAESTNSGFPWTVQVCSGIFSGFACHYPSKEGSLEIDHL